MGITVVHGSPQDVWVPIQDSATIYVGGIVSMDMTSLSEGIIMLPDAAGVANVTNHDVPLGVCIGTNRMSPLYNTTYNCEYITDPGAADAHDGASIDYAMVEGSYAKGDPIAMAKVSIITPSTVLRAPIYNAAVGTAPTEKTVTTGNTSGLGATVSAIDFTPETSPQSTVYMRSGNNAGAYRHMDLASTTVLGWDKAMKSDVAIGDKLVCVPYPTFGPANCMFDGTSATFLDCADNPVLAGTDRWAIFVHRLDLSVAGQEYLEFRFDTGHFGQYITNA